VASYLVVLLVLAALLVIGAARTLLSWRRVRGRLKFTNEYLSRYKKLLESYIPRGPNATLDEAEYDWLTARVNRMQRELGGRGSQQVTNLPPLERVMNSIRNGIGMRETEIAREPS
jgi:hypothetical protein